MNGLEKYLIFVMVLWILMTLIYVSLGKTIICDHMWYYSASSILVCVCCETFVSFSATMRNSLHTSSTPVISWTTGTSTDATSKNPELQGLVTLCIICRNYWNTGLMLRSHCIKPRSFGKVFIAVEGLSMIWPNCTLVIFNCVKYSPLICFRFIQNFVYYLITKNWNLVVEGRKITSPQTM